MTSTSLAPAGPAGIVPALRRLYFVRCVFALVWAGLLAATASSLGPVSATLLVLYPLFDAFAALVDARSARAATSPGAGAGSTGHTTTTSMVATSAGTTTALGSRLNIAVSVLAAGALAAAATSGIPAVLRAWGVWAIVSGLIQLVMGVSRRGLGGQWPMIVSGGISTLAGATFIVQAGNGHPSLSSAAGYAVLGGLFFLGSALRLGRGANG